MYKNKWLVLLVLVASLGLNLYQAQLLGLQNEMIERIFYLVND